MGKIGFEKHEPFLRFSRKVNIKNRSKQGEEFSDPQIAHHSKYACTIVKKNCS